MSDKHKANLQHQANIDFYWLKWTYKILKYKLLELLPYTIYQFSNDDELFSFCSAYMQLPSGALLIKSTEIRDSGIYICIAQNNAGNDIRQMSLEVQGTYIPSTKPQF